MITPFVHAIGTAVPANKIAQQLQQAILVAANGMDRAETLRLQRIYSQSGVESRHSVLSEFGHEDREENEVFHPSGLFSPVPVSKRMALFERHAIDLCVNAAADCIGAISSLSKSEITHLLSFSCTGMYAPGLDIQLVERLELNRNVERTCINFMGCYAAINALKLAYHIVRSQPDAVVLLCGVELCSLHYQKSNEPDQVVANALFGDGAAAVIVSAKTFSEETTKFCLLDFYSEFEQSASNDMVWRIGDEGFNLKLTMEVPRVVRSNIASLANKLFDKAGLGRADISHYAIHPGGVRILEASEEALQISKAQNEIAYGVLRDHGNMSSVTILFVLKELLQKLNARNRGEKIFACAFGPGITMESMIFEVC